MTNDLTCGWCKFQDVCDKDFDEEACQEIEPIDESEITEYNYKDEI